MGLLIPAALGLLGFAGVVVALHMLKVRRRDVAVPSVRLWRRLPRDAPASRPWQPPPPSLELLLQILAVAALAVALARPFVTTPDRLAQRVVILVDQSASMGAVEGGETRWEAARSELIRRVESAGDTVFTVVTYDERPSILASGTADPDRVIRVLNQIEPKLASGNLPEALRFAAGLAGTGGESEVLLVTDAAGEAVSLSSEVPIHRVEVGASGDNQGLVATFIDDYSAESPVLFALVRNWSTAPVTREMTVRVDDVLFDVRELAFDARGEIRVSLPLPQTAEVAAVSLVGADTLAADDRAWAVRQADSVADVAVVGPPNRFIETALGLFPRVGEITWHASSPSGLADMVVALGRVPEGHAGRGAQAGEGTDGGAGFGNPFAGSPAAASALPLVLFQPVDGAEAALVGTLESPVPRVVAPDHPLLAGVDLSEVHILEAAAYELGPHWEVLVSAEVAGRTWPLVAVGALPLGRSGGGLGPPAVLMAFDPAATDLPLQPAFPILLANTVTHLAPTGLDLPGALSPGALVRVRVPPDARGARLIGEDTDLVIDGTDLFLSAPDVPGVYRLEVELADGLARETFAVNFEASEEGDVAPGTVAVTAADDGPGAGAPGRRPVWAYLAAAGLAAAVAEWTWSHRDRVPSGLPWD